MVQHIITTSAFTPAAHERARKHRAIELINGADLQDLLDKHFSEKLYRVLD